PGFVDLYLLVEAVGDGLQLVDGGIVLLCLDALHVRLLLGLQLVASLGNGVIELLVDAGRVVVDRLLVRADGLLSGNHVLERCGPAVWDLRRSLRVGAVCIRCCGSRGERDREKSLHKTSPGARDRNAILKGARERALLCTATRARGPPPGTCVARRAPRAQEA